MNRMHWITLALAAALALAACGDKDDSGSDDTGTSAVDDTGSTSLDACSLAQQWASCDECYSGEVTCEYGETSATEGSCQDCQARGALYAELCDAGVTDSRADIEAGTTCSDPV
jgi:hypothetical protein